MIIENLNKDLAKELFIVLSYCDDSLIDNIPESILEHITSLAADSEKVFYLDKGKSLLDQNISDDCKDLLSLIYYTYGADIDEKNVILNAWGKNEMNANAN